jgi:hypothetical protein
MNTHTTARRHATIEGWLHQPADTRGQPSEGHTSAVNVLRMVNSSREHRSAEPVPFRAKPAPLRSIKPTTTQRRATGCAGAGGSCISHPDCPDVNCEGHPDNMDLDDSQKSEQIAIAQRFGIALAAGLAALAWVLWG